MMSSSHPTARKFAYKALQTIFRTQTFANDVFDIALRDVSLSAQDRGLAFELVYGILRQAILLDWRLDQISRKPMARLPLNVATTLRIAAYQLLFLDRIPESAAVNESVKLIRSQPGHDWGGLVNAILRNLIRQPAPPFPDPHTDPVRAFSIRYSCPPWLVERWIQIFGLAQAEGLCRQTLDIPPITLRTNTLRCTRQALLERLRSEKVSVQDTVVSPVGLTLEKCGPPGHLPVVQEGWCYIEDEAAQLIPPLLDPQPSERILDACAAPGGKTTHLAQLMGNQGRIIALDRQEDRVARLKDNCQRLGIGIVQAFPCDVVSDALPANLLAQPFDRILVDAPCSGLGVLRRHPEGKMFKQPSIIAQSRVTQGQILDRVGHLLRPGGILVYSACSIEPEETTDVVADFCHRHPEFHQDSLAAWVPVNGHTLLNQTGQLCTAWNSWKMDGFFACRLMKTTK
ncbi:MAG: 16S rRNA (cytosine(967)-C(5))-methyltransferase RsmB [Nitrospira sp.]|nr:16S rRNA (cytosine(967)-C(5))-methyltransferase RsmB [Nitrospira sp.]